MSTETMPRGVHLVGSVPLTSADEVFRTWRATWVTMFVGFLTGRPATVSDGFSSSSRF